MTVRNRKAAVFSGFPQINSRGAAKMTVDYFVFRMFFIKSFPKQEILSPIFAFKHIVVNVIYNPAQRFDFRHIALRCFDVNNKIELNLASVNMTIQFDQVRLDTASAQTPDNMQHAY